MLTRSDLSPAQQAVQAVHAAIETARHGLIPADTDHPHLVLLAVPGEHELELAARKLRLLGIPHKEFREPDRNNELTALATAPLDGEYRKYFRKYRLFTPEQEAVA